jgi:hypothetical protein
MNLAQKIYKKFHEGRFYGCTTVVVNTLEHMLFEREINDISDNRFANKPIYGLRVKTDSNVKQEDYKFY